MRDRIRFAARFATRAYLDHPLAPGADALIVIGLLLWWLT